MCSNDFTNANNLIAGFRRVRKASGWKAATQCFGINMLKEVRSLQRELRGKTYEQGPGSTFKMCEQGHLRLVKALSVRDTVAQHSLCEVVLTPTLSAHIIHDNGASLKGKGISFTRRRFEQHLHWHYMRYGLEGYALKIDFRKYFDNIRHDVLRENMGKYVVDENAMRTFEAILKANRIDISFTDDPAYIDKVFNSLEYTELDRRLLTGLRFMEKSMGIGSPTSQISGVFMPTPIDTWCKTVRGIHCYEAYMDDRIIIHPSKEFLKKLLEEIRAIAQKLGLHINMRKTQIVKLSHGFTFLKTKYILTKSGKIIRRIPRDVVVRQRRKMKKLARFAVEGSLSLKAFSSQYKGWRGDKNRYHASRTIRNMDKLHRRLKKWIAKRNTPSQSRESAASSR